MAAHHAMIAATFPSAPRRLAAACRNALLFFAGFCGSSWIAGRWLPFPDVPEVSEKRAHFLAHAGEYDALFLGSSRIELQVMPAVFDQRLAELGAPLHSFNAGVSAMAPPEDAFFFDEITRARPPRLRWVFIELGPVRLDVDRARGGSERMSYWHDAGRTLLMWQCFRAEWRQTRSRLARKNQRDKSTAERLLAYQKPVQSGLEHLLLFIKNAVHLGRGATLAARFLDVGAARTVSNPTTAAQGWVRMDALMDEKNRAPYERAYAERLTEPQRAKAGNPAGAEALRRLVKKVVAAGATPVLVIPPTTAATHFEAPPEIRQTCAVLDFSDIHAFQELYRIEHRLDVEHLNILAAPLFSRLLAEAFFAKARPQP
jgi:hypothetical protein